MRANYKIGYGRPPRHARFRKGKSGNPKGRPKRAKNLPALLWELLYKRINVREGGRVQRISTWEAIFKQLIAKTIQGDPRARRDLLNCLEKFGYFEGQMDDPQSSQYGAIVYLPHNHREPLDEQDVIEEPDAKEETE